MNTSRKKTRTITVTEHGEDSSEDDESLSENNIESAFDSAKQIFGNFEDARADCIGETQSCPLCQYCFRPENAHTKDPILKRMFQIYRSNIGSSPPEEVAILLTIVYDKEYRLKELEKGNMEVLVLTIETATRHLRFHMFSYRKALDDSIQDMIFMERDMKNANFVLVGSKGGGLKRLPVKQNFTLYLNLLKEKRAYVLAANTLKAGEKT